MSTVDLSGYKEVAERIADFREKYPEGCLRPANPESPYTLEFIAVEDKAVCFVVYVAAAYRTPDDPLPGIGAAWEPFPGLTPYTKNSELMNAETSAWGRAIIAVGASEAKKIATKEDVERRQAEEGATSPPAARSGEKASKPVAATAPALDDFKLPFAIGDRPKGASLCAIAAEHDTKFLGWFADNYGLKGGKDDPRYAERNEKARALATRLFKEQVMPPEGSPADADETPDLPF